MPKVERRVPVIKKAAVAVKVATTRISQLKERLQERDATIAQLRQEVASAMADAEKSRERADKLEARFTQVCISHGTPSDAVLCCQLEFGAGMGYIRFHRAALQQTVTKLQQDTRGLLMAVFADVCMHRRYR